MISDRLATIAIAGTNSFFAYHDKETTYATMSAPGFFNDAINSLDAGSLIISVNVEGTALHIVSNTNDGVVSTAGFQFTLTSNLDSVNANADFNFATTVAHNRHIDRDEIETAIADAGFDNPVRSVTIYIEDTGNLNKLYLCRYEADADEWFHELLNRSR